MTKRLMPYGSRNHSSLLTKTSDPGKLAERASVQLAINAFTNSRDFLAKGGMQKLTGLDEPVTRLVRLNKGNV